jgi:hypothetical protein
VYAYNSSAFTILSGVFEKFSKTEKTKRKCLFDNYCCFYSGVIESIFKIFALVIAVRISHASKIVNSFWIAADSVGYSITAITQSLAIRKTRRTARDLFKIYILTFVVPSLLQFL